VAAYETLRYDVADGVATIALNQPDTRNALSEAMLDDLLAAFGAAGDDDAVRCVVLASTHPKNMPDGRQPRRLRRRRPVGPPSPRRPVPPALFELIGALASRASSGRGHVLAGARLALACDLIVASDEACSAPEINVGVFPFVISALIVRNVGRRRRADAARGADRRRRGAPIGIVNRVVLRPSSTTRPRRPSLRARRHSSCVWARTRSTAR
jgi:enoyl-CoA hydratase/carnithine racemase